MCAPTDTRFTMPEVEQILISAVDAHKAGNLAEAERLYRLILKTNPHHCDANHNLGLLLSSMNKVAEAIPVFRTALQANAGLKQFWFSYFEALRATKRFAELEVAIENAKRHGLREEEIEAAIAESKYPDSRPFRAHNQPSRDDVQNLLQLFQAGDLLDVEQSAREMTQQFPNYCLGWKILGAVLLRLNQRNAANVANQKAVEISPEDYEAHNNLSVTQRTLGNLAEAKRSSERAIELNPNFSQAHNNLGITLREAGKHEQALASFQTAAKLDVGNPNAHNNVGNALKHLGRPDEALKSYTRAVEINPAFEDALMNRWRLLFDAGSFHAALRDVSRCRSQQASANMLETLYALGRVDEVYERIAELAETDPKNIRIAAFSAFLKSQEGQKTCYDFCDDPLSFVHFANLSSQITNVPRFTSDLVAELQEITNVWEPANRATHKGLRTPTHLNLFSSPSGRLAELELVVRREIEAYKKKFLGESCSYVTKWPTVTSLHGWCVNLQRQGYQSLHIHPAGWLSGVVYLKVLSPTSATEGAIEFSLNGKNYTQGDAPGIIHEPDLGDIVLFPSSLHHRTIPFQENTNRISVAFDLKPNSST